LVVLQEMARLVMLVVLANMARLMARFLMMVVFPTLAQLSYVLVPKILLLIRWTDFKTFDLAPSIV
jgi:hypothetical protein